MTRRLILLAPLMLAMSIILFSTPILSGRSPALAASELPSSSYTSELNDRIVPPIFCYSVLLFIAGTTSYDDKGRPVYDSGWSWIHHWVCESPATIISTAVESYVETEDKINGGFRDAGQAVVDAITGLFD